MPRKSTSGPYFYVYVMSYASTEVKERIERGAGRAEPGEITASVPYRGASEYKAAQAFYRACKSALRNPLVYEVLVQRSQETIADVRITHES
jgi:hypothetical protein